MDIAALRDDRGFISILDLSAPQQLADALGLDKSLPTNLPVLKDILSALLTAGVPQVTAAALEAEWGLPLYSSTAADDTTKPVLLLRIDYPAASPNQAQVPSLLPEWGVEHIKNNYALALLELPYHPQEELALQKKQLVAELFDFCRIQGTQLVVTLRIFDPKNPQSTQALTSDIQLIAIQELRATVNALGLEVPSDPLAIATLTAELDIPWLALPAPGQNLAEFQARLHQAMENGAQGYVANEVLWPEVGQLKRADVAPDIEQIHSFITQNVAERLETLNGILTDTARA